MIKHYDNLVFSKIVKDKDYLFTNPVFGKSNTDQSYYEPTASLVQNAQKSGTISSSLHNDAEQSIADIRATCDFLPNYMTQEELNSYIVNQREIVESSIKDVNAKISAIKDEVNFNNKIVQNSSDSDS